MTWHTAKPRQPALQSCDERILENFTVVLSRLCAQVSWHAVTDERASTIISCSDPSRISLRMAAKRSGTSVYSPCSRHGAHPSVPACLLFVHRSASGSARHVASRRAMAARPAGHAVGVLRIAVRRFWRLPNSRGRLGARSRAELEMGAKWRATAAPQPRRARRKCAAYA